MTFSEALVLLRSYRRLSRPEYGFNYVYLTPNSAVSGNDLPVFAIRLGGGAPRIWFPTHEDLLADDWFLV